MHATNVTNKNATKNGSKKHNEKCKKMLFLNKQLKTQKQVCA